MNNLRDRERKLDVNKLSPEQVENLSVQIGDKVRSICDETTDKLNMLLKIYGLSAKIAIVFNDLDGNEVSRYTKKTRKKRKTKRNNLK